MKYIQIAVASRKKCINRQCIVKDLFCTQVIHVKVFLTGLWPHDGNYHILDAECKLELDAWGISFRKLLGNSTVLYPKYQDRGEIIEFLASTMDKAVVDHDYLMIETSDLCVE